MSTFILAGERELIASRGQTSESLFMTCGTDCGFELIFFSRAVQITFVGYCFKCLLVVKR